jgi:hypothetical protein
MRHSERSGAIAALVLSFALALVANGHCACVLALDDEFDSGVRDAIVDAPPTAHGCLPFHDAPGVSALTGAGRSLDLGGGESLWWFDGATTGSGAIRNTGLVAENARLVPGCTWASAIAPNGALRSISTTSPIGGSNTVSLLDGVTTPRGTFAYYALYEPASGEPFGVRGVGFGAAMRDESGVFQPTPSLLWSADRPSYGSAVVATSDFVYVFGCRPAESLAEDCFVARAAVTSDLVSPASYAYDANGAWSASPDDALPIARGGTSLSVKWNGRVSRYLMTYAPPLSREIRMRSALTPEGPWSAETTLARCDVASADPDAFCTGVHQHPEVKATSPRAIVVSYGVASFKVDATLAPEAYWPRVVELELPADVP